uniref:Uncharacterized protein n=1 Tax=Rhizophora mucronata TaxID=61149 RepID=A0A2P2QLS7_RHIMU
MTCFLTSSGNLKVNRSVFSPGWTKECPVECERGNLCRRGLPDLEPRVRFLFSV